MAAAAARYVRDQPFSAGSTLLFVTVPGARTSTNRPELFAHMPPDNGETRRRAGSGEPSLRASARRAPQGYSTVALADVGDLRLLKRAVRIRGGLHATIGVGEPLAAVAHAQRGVARAFILAGLLALAGALLASYLIGARLSRPLRRMAAVAARVDAGDLHPRIHDTGGQGDEVKVLADAFNHMLDRLTDAFAGQRAFVADASHELRTPLTVIRGQLEVLAAQRDPSGEEVRRVERLVQAEIARISRLVDDLLLLAKTEQTEFLQVERIDLARLRARAVGWDEPDRRSPLRARPGAGGHAASRSRSAGAGAAQPARQRDRPHRARATGSCGCGCEGRPAGGCASSSRTTDRASPWISVSGSSTASTAPTRRAIALLAGRAWGWRSCVRSPTRTAGG